MSTDEQILYTFEGSGRIHPLYDGERFDSKPSQVKVKVEVVPGGENKRKLSLEPAGPDWPWDYGVIATESKQDGCLCRCVSRVYDEDELRALNMFRHWLHGHLDREMLATKAREIADQQKKLLKSLQAEINDPNASAGASKTDLQKRYDEAYDQKAKAEKVMRKAEIAREEGRLLEGTAKSVRQKRAMKSMSYWQNILGYLFYFIVIINIVITGLGLSGSI